MTIFQMEALEDLGRIMIKKQNGKSSGVIVLLFI